MQTKNRLAQLEKRKPQADTRTASTNVSEAMHARSMDALAAVLSDIGGGPVTRAELDKALKELNQ